MWDCNTSDFLIENHKINKIYITLIYFWTSYLVLSKMYSNAVWGMAIARILTYPFLWLIHYLNETALGLHVYQKGPPVEVRWAMQGWGGSCRGGVDHTEVGWVMQGWGGLYRGGVGHKGVRWVMQGWVIQVWVGHAGVGWVMQGRGGVGHAHVGWCGNGVGHVGVGWDGSCRGGVRWVIQM